TAASPTLDRGSNATVPAALKFDYEGQRRILGPAVDMGADELLDAVRPKILALAIKPAVFVPGSARATLSFRLSERARLAFTVARVRPGRRVNGHCVKRTKANAGKPKCKRLVPQGGFSVQAAAGRGSTQFDGRVGTNHRKLAPGTYRISAVAVDVQGNRSASRSTTVRLDGQH
ncbi:MAG: choice-of-anchor Q domain-containing protein, partial [Thermoleophilaceae bacterium]